MRETKEQATNHLFLKYTSVIMMKMKLKKMSYPHYVIRTVRAYHFQYLWREKTLSAVVSNEKESLDG